MSRLAAPRYPKHATIAAIRHYEARRVSFQAGEVLRRLMTSFDDLLPSGATIPHYGTQGMPTGTVSDGMAKFIRLWDNEASHKTYRLAWIDLCADHPQTARLMLAYHVEMQPIGVAADNEGVSARYAALLVSEGNGILVQAPYSHRRD